MKALREPGVYKTLESKSERLTSGLAAAAEEAGIPARLTRVGSLMTLFFTSRVSLDWQRASAADTKRYAAFVRRMLERGVYLPPSQYEGRCLSLAQTDEQSDRMIEAAGESLAGMSWGPQA